MYFRTTGRVTLEAVAGGLPTQDVTVMLAHGTLLWVAMNGAPDGLGRIPAISIHPDGAAVSRHRGALHQGALMGRVEPLGGAEADRAELLIWGANLGPPHAEVAP